MKSCPICRTPYPYATALDIFCTKDGAQLESETPSSFASQPDTLILPNTLPVDDGIGISRIYNRGSGRNEELANHILKSHDLKIMALSAASIRIHITAIVTALVNNECKVKVLIAKENSDFVSEVERLEPYRHGQIHAEIEHTRTRLLEIVNRANDVRHKRKPIGRVWLGRYMYALRSSLLICDNNWCWLTLNLPPKRASESVSFVIEKVSDGLIDDCINHFESVWELYKNEIEEITLIDKNSENAEA